MFIDFYSICSYILYDTMSLLAVWTLMSKICNWGSIDGHSTWWSAMLQACHKSNKNQWCILPNDNLFWGRGGNYPSPVDLELFSEPCWRFARATRLQPLWLHHYCIFLLPHLYDCMKWLALPRHGEFSAKYVLDHGDKRFRDRFSLSHLGWRSFSTVSWCTNILPSSHAKWCVC